MMNRLTVDKIRDFEMSKLVYSGWLDDGRTIVSLWASIRLSDGQLEYTVQHNSRNVYIGRSLEIALEYYNDETN